MDSAGGPDAADANTAGPDTKHAADTTGAPDTGNAPDTSGAPDTGGTPDAGGMGDSAAGGCGDGTCAPDENAVSCPADCNPGAAVCGDGVCADTEAIPTCAIDCDAKSKDVWICAGQTCPGQRTACAVNAGCMASWQTAMQCLKVCGYQASCMAQCGKELASPAEAQALSSCALPGCLSAKATCGDGACQSGETPQSCPADCQGGGSSCGDGTCDATESPQSCPADCQGGGGGATCGDETCSSGEDANGCPLDCEADAGKVWGCLQSQCPSEKAACQADASCLKALNEAAICVKKCGGGSACVQQCQGPVVGNSNALSLGLCTVQKCQTP